MSLSAKAFAELRAALEGAFDRHFGRTCRIVRLMSRPFVFRTSFAMLEVDAMLDDGMHLSLLLKDLGRQGLLESARRAKPDFLYDPLREIEMYRTLLSAHGRGTALCYGAVVDPAADRYWLLLEKVPGRELYQVGEFEVWRKVAGWLGDFHACLGGESSEGTASAHLLTYDRDYYRLWPSRALAFAQDGLLGGEPAAWRLLERLAGGYNRVVERLLTLPTTVIHGEFYASNVLVQGTASALRVCPVDWEMAAIGPGLVDLAALAAGNWTEEQRRNLLQAYRLGLIAAKGKAPEMGELLVALDCCRLHLDLQWLGWARSWVPPPEHAQDWLSEARHLAARLGL